MSNSQLNKYKSALKKCKWSNYFDSFGVEHILKDIRKFIGNKSVVTNIYRVQAYNSVIYGYFCIEFIDFMLKGKNLLEYTNFFPPNDYEKNYRIILKNSQ